MPYKTLPKKQKTDTKPEHENEMLELALLKGEVLALNKQWNSKEQSESYLWALNSNPKKKPKKQYKNNEKLTNPYEAVAQHNSTTIGKGQSNILKKLKLPNIFSKRNNKQEKITNEPIFPKRKLF